MPYWTDITLVAAAYLIGSVSFAIVVTKMLHLSDPRLVGSKNPGTTNVMREVGRRAGLLTFAGDFLKAVAAIALAMHFGVSESAVILAGLAVFLGHLFPLYHRFRGGKGIATLLGCLTIWDWQIALLTAVVWSILFVMFRYVSLASIFAAAVAPLIAWTLMQSQLLVSSMILMAILIILKHHANIRRLWIGEENKVGAS